MFDIRKKHDPWNVYRIGFIGLTPVYPDDFKWRDGATYALALAGGTLDAPFHSEADFMEKVKDEPPEPECHFIIVLLDAPDLTQAQRRLIRAQFGKIV
ncbi:hypothetical protein [Asticcacaulis excentricus]|nr:hypothetical protein [Asticcacaulis excentricus]